MQQYLRIILKFQMLRNNICMDLPLFVFVCSLCVCIFIYMFVYNTESLNCLALSKQFCILCNRMIKVVSNENDFLMNRVFFSLNQILLLNHSQATIPQEIFIIYFSFPFFNNSLETQYT